MKPKVNNNQCPYPANCPEKENGTCCCECDLSPSCSLECKNRPELCGRD